jgi:hypothetical protein
MKLIALLTIPDEILTSILVCWSELRSIAKLDLACCNTNIRDDVLNCFRHKYIILPITASILLAPTVCL